MAGQKAPRMERRHTSTAAGARSSKAGSVVTTGGGGSVTTVNPGAQPGARTFDDLAAAGPGATSPAPGKPAAAAPGDVDEDQGDNRGRGRGFQTPRVLQRFDQPAGWLVALFLYPLAVNLLKGGPPRMFAWISNKFTNQSNWRPGQAQTTGVKGPGPATAITRQEARHGGGGQHGGGQHGGGQHGGGQHGSGGGRGPHHQEAAW